MHDFLVLLVPPLYTAVPLCESTVPLLPPNLKGRRRRFTQRHSGIQSKYYGKL